MVRTGAKKLLGATDTQATVITADGETVFFDTEAGFNDKDLQLHPRHRRKQPAKYITDLDFADDMALVSDLVADTESLLQSLEKAASRTLLQRKQNRSNFNNSKLQLSIFCRQQYHPS